MGRRNQSSAQAVLLVEAGLTGTEHFSWLGSSPGDYIRSLS